MANSAVEVDQMLFDEMHRVDPDEEYFAITLSLDADGEIAADILTMWAEQHPDHKGWEMREGRLVSHQLFDLTHGAGNYLVVHNEEQLPIWIAVGGPALVEEETGRTHLADVVGPSPAVADPRGGYRNPSELPDGSLRRQPSPKLRAAVLKRDGYRCRICGRDADDSIDIRLHVHHVRPWEFGGVTEMTNLITLCHTCHEGIDPHYELALVQKAAPPRLPGEIRPTAEPYRELRVAISTDGK